MSLHPRFDELCNLLHARSQRGGEYACICPAHEDDKPSLHMKEGEKAIVLDCKAGCTCEEICAAIGWKVSDLFYEQRSKHYDQNRDHSKPHVVARYPYTDADGCLLYVVTRMSNKEFPVSRPDGNGGWIRGLGDTPRVLYQLPSVLQGIRDDKVIFVVEGEKDVHTLHKLGCVATTAPGGKGQGWRDSYSQYLSGAHVILIPDNDVPGCQHIMEAAPSIAQHATSVKYLQLPGLPPKGDVSDWLAIEGNTPEKFFFWAQLAHNWIPMCQIEPSEEAKAEYAAHHHSKFVPITPPDKLPDGEFMLTDYGNAERLTTAHGANLRYNIDRGQWLRWNDVLWREDSTGYIQRLAISTVRNIYDEVAALYAKMKDCSTPEERKALNARADLLQRHAVASEKKERLNAMITLAQHCEGIPVQITELNSDPWLFCCANGILDLRNGELNTPDQRNLITKQSAITYDPDARCPRWLAFLDDILPDKPEVQAYLQRAVGYTLTGDVSEQCLFFLFGAGQNGKSTFLEIITSLLGDYFQKTRADTVMTKRYGGGIPNDVAMLAGSRFVLVSELSGNQHFDESLVKDLTGGDTISARFLNKEFFSFRAGFKLWMYGNAKPRIHEKSEGIWRRIRLIPFLVQVPEHKRDNSLPDKLRAELPGILNWAVQGCLDWQKQGLNAPAEVKVAVDDYRREQDLLAAFIETHCLIRSNEQCTKKDLFNAYKVWCNDNSEPGYDTARQFNNDIRSRPGIREMRGTGNAPIWRGIRLKTDEEIELDEQKSAGLLPVIHDDVMWLHDDN